MRPVVDRRRHADAPGGYPTGMGDREHTKQPVEELRAVDTDAVPDEEGVSDASAAETVDESPEGQVNRPDQEDFDPAEREQYQQPIAEADRPEDR